MPLAAKDELSDRWRLSMQGRSDLQQYVWDVDLLDQPSPQVEQSVKDAVYTVSWIGLERSG